ncbi:hypothetical protein MJG53_015380 [Ovis ammon polii x Ovis aries]|uniref:Uncharacterized protein n=1 Tax=Ovis ammon polii x Ovis aries TaxID=2918886 RepID=A0ACB9UF14_9CETA|nr:hypothetical protein MJG53_015380 [Ovis ammon polii x Ovis aries]
MDTRFGRTHWALSTPILPTTRWIWMWESISRYQLAVTQRKETEPRSSSIFNQNDPWTPTAVFADFVNNETIAGKDLVAWVTAGFLRIPHAEDIPNTVTVGNSVGFFLRPYNFFDEDPSICSADSIFFQENQDAGSCESGDRPTQFGLYYNIAKGGSYLHPVGLALHVDHKALDPAQWTIQKLFFQGRYYESLAQLEEQFEAGQVNVVVIPNNGTAMFTRPVNSGIGMGYFPTPLIRVECPYQASYMDWHFVVESQAPKTPHDAFDSAGLRSVSTMLNYDYVWDLVFYPNGAIEVKFHATGYISSAFFFGEAQRCGNQVGEKTLGAIHTHSAHYKVDLDVGGLGGLGDSRFLYIPHAEDIPNMVTVGNSVSFFLQPRNFFDHEPSVSSDSINSQEVHDAGSY